MYKMGAYLKNMQWLFVFALYVQWNMVFSSGKQGWRMVPVLYTVFIMQLFMFFYIYKNSHYWQRSLRAAWPAGVGIEQEKEMGWLINHNNRDVVGILVGLSHKDLLGYSVHTRQNAHLKGQSNEIFDLHFFHHSNQFVPLINKFKYFRFLLRFR